MKQISQFLHMKIDDASHVEFQLQGDCVILSRGLNFIWMKILHWFIILGLTLDTCF